VLDLRDSTSKRRKEKVEKKKGGMGKKQKDRTEEGEGGQEKNQPFPRAKILASALDELLMVVV